MIKIEWMILRLMMKENKRINKKKQVIEDYMIIDKEKIKVEWMTTHKAKRTKETKMDK